MKKQKSTETKNMVQTALWLPREMYQQLQKKAGERGLGEEIRRRLRGSFEVDEPPDKTTDIFISAVNQLAIELDEPWYANHFNFEVFKAAINELLSQCQSTEQAGSEAISKLQASCPDEKPETIGRIFARIALHHFKNLPRWPSYPSREDRPAHKRIMKSFDRLANEEKA
jgi:hypothetical protein